MNKNIKILVNSVLRKGSKGFFPVYILGPLVFLLLVWLIYHQILRQPDWKGSLSQVLHALRGPGQWKLWLVLALMPLNWGIEACKWRLAFRNAGGIPFKDAIRAIFAGTAIASFTPNRMGEYLGRLMYVKEGKRIDSISLTIVGSMAQLLITLLVGMAGLVFLHPFVFRSGVSGPQLAAWMNVLLVAVFLLWVSLTIIYFKLSWLVGILSRISWLRRYIAHIKILETFDATVLLRILFLSFVRYLVFIIQYGLVFPAFGVTLSIGQLWGGVSVVFLVMAVVPTFTFLTELGLRWEAGIQILQLFSSNTVGIFAASFAIWLVNLIIPALIGSFLILRIKFFRSK